MSEKFGRQLYSIGESYKIMYNGIRTIGAYKKAKSRNLLDSKFIERIMLAVTEVNSCPLCSYAHTKIALETGISHDEIKNMLDGIVDTIPNDEIEGVLFAQHYADKRGNPSKESWHKVVWVYGKIKAEGILAATRMIMMGNAYGIPLGSFKNRFRGKPDERSNLLYEVGMLLTFIIFLPISLVHTIFSALLKKPLITFN
jgi:AhpD family alkylhydroperoxidase